MHRHWLNHWRDAIQLLRQRTYSHTAAQTLLPIQTVFIIILTVLIIIMAHWFSHTAKTFLSVQNCVDYHTLLPEWDLAERSERCASFPKVTGSNPSGGSESTFRSDLLLTARGSRTCAPIVVACLLCYPGNTLCSQRLEPPERARYSRLYTNPQIYFFMLLFTSTKLCDWLW
jgi:hypothetical protein